jgi:hypothetical protein
MSLPISSTLPLNKAFSNPQLSLFQDFVCNNNHERQQLSNTIELWDSIPGYSMSRTYLTELVTVSRKEKDADPDAKWMARFHPLVSQSIECLSYRQFNYSKLMQHKRQLTRWMSYTRNARNT